MILDHDWRRNWNETFRDGATVLSILVTGLLALLYGNLPNTRFETLWAVPSNHPFLWYPFVGLSFLLVITLILLLMEDVEKGREANRLLKLAGGQKK